MATCNLHVRNQLPVILNCAFNTLTQTTCKTKNRTIFFTLNVYLFDALSGPDRHDRIKKITHEKSLDSITLLHPNINHLKLPSLIFPFPPLNTTTYTI